MVDLYPSKLYIVEIRDKYGNFKKLLKNPYPQNSTAYYNTIKDARKNVEYRKKHRDYEFEQGDKIIIKAVPFSDFVDMYRSKRGPSKRYSPEQIKKMIKEREEDESYGPPYHHSIPSHITDELEGRDEYEIFMNAAGHTISKPGSMERGIKALKEYREGIERKRKITKHKIKRRLLKKCKCKK